MARAPSMSTATIGIVRSEVAQDDVTGWDVLPRAIRMLRDDPSRHVRAIAAEVVGRWVHVDRAAEGALLDAHENDPASAVRKKAGWYAPGGTIYRRTQPR